MSKLIDYLPVYYQESRQMNAIMDAVEPDIPDVDHKLAKAFFLSGAPDEWLYLWQSELNESNREALLAKLRSSGTLNQETLRALGLFSLETYQLSPEDGYMLSGEDAMLPDGKFYGPLISSIYANPDNIQVVKNLVSISGLAGIRYWFTMQVQEYAKQTTGSMGTLRNLYPGITMEEKLNWDELSGPAISTGSNRQLFYSNHVEAAHSSWWSPNISFLDPIDYTAARFVTQQSSITVSKEE